MQKIVSKEKKQCIPLCRKKIKNAEICFWGTKTRAECSQTKQAEAEYRNVGKVEAEPLFEELLSEVQGQTSVEWMVENDWDKTELKRETESAIQFRNKPYKWPAPNSKRKRMCHQHCQCQPKPGEELIQEKSYAHVFSCVCFLSGLCLDLKSWNIGNFYFN